VVAKDLGQPSQIWKFLMQSRPEIILFTAITPRPAAVEQRIKNFLTKWPLVKQKLPFPEMPEMRITPDLPDYKKVMDEAFLLLLDGKLRSHNEIVKFLTPYSPPEPPPPPPPPRRGRGAKKESAGAAAPAGETGSTGPKKRGRKPKALAMAESASVQGVPVATAPAAAVKSGPGPVAAVSAKPLAAAGKTSPGAKPSAQPKPAAAPAKARPSSPKAAPAKSVAKAAPKKAKAAPAKPSPKKKAQAKKTRR
jgi:hypothetical protein